MGCPFQHERFTRPHIVNDPSLQTSFRYLESNETKIKKLGVSLQSKYPRAIFNWLLANGYSGVLNMLGTVVDNMPAMGYCSVEVSVRWLTECSVKVPVEKTTRQRSAGYPTIPTTDGTLGKIVFCTVPNSMLRKEIEVGDSANFLYLS